MKRKDQFSKKESLEHFTVKQFWDYKLHSEIRCHIGFNKAHSAIKKKSKELESRLTLARSFDVLERAKGLPFPIHQNLSFEEVYF